MRTASRVRLAVGSVALLTLCMSGDVVSYEQTTHAAMTREAMMQSQLSAANSDLLQRLGIAERQTSLRSIYLDFFDEGPTTFRSRDPTGAQYPAHFGPSKVKDANRSALFQPPSDSLPEWLMLGAIREDDVPFDNGAAENNPQDEPLGATNRVFNHFYDPYNDLPLHVGALALGWSASDWALRNTEFNLPGDPGNHFNALQAREAMWRALTLKSYTPQALTDLPFTANADVPTKEALRVAYWATTFRALGDVVHLLQDMAQPQHTRNDPHSGMGCDPGSGTCRGGHASFFEKYVDLNVKGDSSFTLRERTAWEYLHGSSGSIPDTVVDVRPAPVIYAGYPVPRFADYRSYFVTAAGPASLKGVGLANYSNQGFYSVGTNLGFLGGGYPSPPPTGQGLVDVVLAKGTVKDANAQPVDGVLVLKTGTVVDSLTPAQTEYAVRLSSHSIFDQFLGPTGKPQYTLNHYNYDDQMRLLIPRAVAYSAGLLDFFFRGRLEISPPDEGVYSIVDHAKFASQTSSTDPLGGFNGFKEIRLRLSNSTPAIVTSGDGATVPQGMTGGTLVAVVKFHRNACYRDTLDGEITDQQQFPLCRTNEEEIVVSDPIKVPDPGTIPRSDGIPGSAEFVFKFSDKALPINAWDVVLQVVYRGQLGGESDAVVVGTKQISEPTFITTFNDTDRILIGGSCYDPAAVAATDTLWTQLNSACKPTSGALRYVTSACVDVPLNVRLTTGSASAPVTIAADYSSAQGAPIAPRRFVRFAVLGDAAAATTMTLALNNALSLQNTQPLHFLSYHAEQQDQVSFVANAYQVTRSIVADTHTKHRGIKIWQGQAFVIDGATATVGSPCPEAQIDPLEGTERFPEKSVVTGWDDL